MVPINGGNSCRNVSRRGGGGLTKEEARLRYRRPARGDPASTKLEAG